MSRKHVRALVAYRLEQAEEAIRSAETLLASGLHRDSVNRSYYAMFYAVLALLITRELGTSKHLCCHGLFVEQWNVRNCCLIGKSERQNHWLLSCRDKCSGGHVPGDSVYT